MDVENVFPGLFHVGNGKLGFPLPRIFKDVKILENDGPSLDHIQEDEKLAFSTTC